MSDGKPLSECTLEELVEAVGPRVYRDVGSGGEHTGQVLGQMAILAEISDRDAEDEAIEIAKEKFDGEGWTPAAGESE